MEYKKTMKYIIGAIALCASLMHIYSFMIKPIPSLKLFTAHLMFGLILTYLLVDHKGKK